MVQKAIWDARVKWFDLGVALKMYTASLEAIKLRNKDNPDDCMTELLLEWLNQADPRPTWSCVVTALREPTVGFEQLAEHLENQHVKDTAINSGLCSTHSDGEQSSSNTTTKFGKRRTHEEVSFPHTNDELTLVKRQKTELEQSQQVIDTSTSSAIRLGKRRTHVDEVGPDKKRQKH